MSYFRRGRHRKTKFSITVAELIAECNRYTIDDFFKMRDEMWAKR